MLQRSPWEVSSVLDVRLTDLLPSALPSHITQSSLSLTGAPDMRMPILPTGDMPMQQMLYNAF